MLKTVRIFRLALLLLIAAALAFGFAWLNRTPGVRYVSSGAWHYPGRMGDLTDEERQWAEVAWRYFKNNTQAGTGLTNASDNRPVTNLWQIGDSLIALTAARQLGLVDEVEFDDRLTRLLATLNQLPLTGLKTPNLLYNTTNAAMVDYSNKPATLGWSAQDIARLMTGLRIVALWHPIYSEYLDRIILRWNFCNVVDNNGQLLRGGMRDGKLTPQPEGRLGYSEYGAAALALWGFPSEKSVTPPYQSVIVDGIAIDVDARDPRTTYTPAVVTNTPYVLGGLEYGWQTPGNDTTLLTAQRQRAQNIYRVQEQRWQTLKILTARDEYNLNAAPWHIYDTVFGNGYAWNTLGDDGNFYPSRALVSTRAVFGLWTLWDTGFTDALMAMTRLTRDNQRGWYEGRFEATGGYNRMITLTTNAMVLEALMYKSNYGPLIRSLPQESYFNTRLSDVFNPPRLCMPQERKPGGPQP
ncbi:hypothetical protein CYR55_06800 [Chimaeribacter californicus]|uniref:DUF3131 domain-containing protein n=1 Tax=Chimaeribacter californicus TaxID=2060067 RepID=A0A2N5EBS0_9GAMM|nr:DUF3131 domain-containing protein [Chimaeribacter californicus]PLR39583.1 hypothetical protein CYR55_06800 [Chimaeribacter californicus]